MTVADDCNVCTDFKKVRKSYKNESASSLKTPSAAIACPPDGGQVGRATWTFLHTMAAYYPEAPTESEQTYMAGFIDGLAKFYPCSTCAHHLQDEIVKYPPKLKSNVELSDWFCRMHNEVNIRQGKPVFDCSKVFERWRTGSVNCKEEE